MGLALPNDIGSSGLTYSCNDLCLHSKLGLEPTGKVADAPFAISDDIWYSSDVIEHVSTCKEKNSNKADRGPDISIPNNRQNVG